MGWKTDWMYRCLFQEAKAIWDQAQREASRCTDSAQQHTAPDLLCIRQYGGAHWDMPSCALPVLREWIYDGVKIEEQFPMGDPLLQSGEMRGMFFTRGVMQFHIRADRKRIVLTYLLGPPLSLHFCARRALKT
jgi:hypothetical protein